MPAGTFGGIDHFKLNAHATSHRGKVAIALHLLLSVGKTDAPVPMIVVHRIFKISSQIFIEVDRVRLKANHRLVHAKIRNLRRRVPCCA